MIDHQDLCYFAVVVVVGVDVEELIVAEGRETVGPDGGEVGGGDAAPLVADADGHAW